MLNEGKYEDVMKRGTREGQEELRPEVVGEGGGVGGGRRGVGGGGRERW